MGKLDRRGLTILHNMGKNGLLAPAKAAAALDVLVGQGYATVAAGRYRITPEGETRLLDRSDVSREEEAAIAGRAMCDHEDTAHDQTGRAS